MATYLSNEAAVAGMVIGATHMDTVTPANPSPPTNISSVGETPPNTITVPVAAGTPANPLVFAANSGGLAHEGAANDTTFTIGNYTFVACGEPWSASPNKNHPSSADYTGSTTVFGATQGEDDIGRDAVYADEDLEDEEEDAAEAAREASGGKPRGRPAGSKNQSSPSGLRPASKRK